MNANGRVDILGHNAYNRFGLHDRIPVQQPDTYYKEALTGNWNCTTLSSSFFSAQNIRILQNGIKAGVYNKSNGRFLIGDQEEDTLKIIMRSIYLQHASNLSTNIVQQVAALNKLVLDYCVPQVYGEAQGYIKYKNDVSTLVVPLCRPTSTYRTNTLELKPWF
jgi:hypothetical protein